MLNYSTTVELTEDTLLDVEVTFPNGNIDDAYLGAVRNGNEVLNMDKLVWVDGKTEKVKPLYTVVLELALENLEKEGGLDDMMSASEADYRYDMMREDM